MGAINGGPVILFRVDAPGLSAAVQPAMQQVRDSARATTQAIASDWQRLSAQIRASMAQGASSERDIANSRRQLVSILDREIAGLRQRNELTSKELSNLKAVTLERERQADAIKRGGIGITGGTASALGQVSTQTTLGIERMVDSLVNRYFGGAAGALTRTLRDISYYSNQANGTSGGGMLAGFTSGFSTLVEKIGPATIALTGMVGAMTALAGVSGSITLSLAKQNEQFENMASVTGMSSKQVQIFSELAKENELDISGVVTSIARFQAELGEYVRKGQGANTETIRFVAGVKDLGISVTDVSGKLRNPVSILSDLSDVLRAIPDPTERSARALDILGVRGRELAPLILSSKGALAEMVSEIEKSGPIIGDAQAAQLDKAKSAWDTLTRSIRATGLALKEDISMGFISATGIAAFSPSGQTSTQSGVAFARKMGALPIAPGTSIFMGSQADADADLKRQQAIQAGGEKQLQIEQLRAKYNDALKDSQTEQAAQLLKQINHLESAVSLEKNRLEIFKKINEELYEMRRQHPERRSESPDTIIDQLLHPIGAPVIGGAIDTGSLSTIFGPISSTGALNGALQPTPAAAAMNPADLLKQINDAHKAKFQTQYEIDREAYQDEQDQLDQALQKKLISQQEYNDASKKIAQDWMKAQEELNKQFIDEAGSLFDDLISGNTKKFSKSLLKDVENIALKPFKDAFANYLGGIFSRLNGTVNGTGGKTAGGAGTSTLGPLGGIFGGVFGPNSPGGTPGWWPGNIGINGKPGAGGPAGGGQFGVATQTMYVTANVVNLSGPVSGGSGNGVSLPGSSNFFGFGGNSFFGNNNPFSFAGTGLGGASGGGFGSTLGGLLGKAAPFLASAVLLGSGIGSGNGPSIALGSAGLATAGVGALSNAGKINPNTASTLGGVFGGAGLLGAGLAQGGGAGVISDIAGGAAIGTAILPGIGTAIGAAAGAIAGGIRAIFTGPSWQQAVQNAMTNQAFNRPPSETFSFASNGSIASTLSTGFAQSGNTFSKYALPSNTPFWANAITGKLTKYQIEQLQSEQSGLNPNQPFLGFPTTNPYVGQGPLGYKTGTSPNVSVNLNLPGLMDASMASAVFTQHAQTIAQLVGSQVRQSSSGMGRNIRAAVALP